MQERIWERMKKQADYSEDPIYDHSHSLFSIVLQNGARLKKKKFVKELKNIFDFYVETLGFTRPRYKITVYVNTQGGLTGGGSFDNPSFWINEYSVRQLEEDGPHSGITHELCHALQSGSGGMTSGYKYNYCGWFGNAMLYLCRFYI